jgi:hypothetical protein
MVHSASAAPLTVMSAPLRPDQIWDFGRENPGTLKGTRELTGALPSCQGVPEEGAEDVDG